MFLNNAFKQYSCKIWKIITSILKITILIIFPLVDANHDINETQIIGL